MEGPQNRPSARVQTPRPFPDGSSVMASPSINTFTRCQLLSLCLIFQTYQCYGETPAALLDPAKAGMAFQRQGEYTGTVKIPNHPELTVGLQVIALGDDKFELTVYEGGLPGNGAKRVNQRFPGKVQADCVEFVLPQGTAKLRADSVEIFQANSTTVVGTLKKIQRVSPTMGMKPPPGASVLFDGTTAAAFIDGRMTEDHLLMEGTSSHLRFQNCQLHLEFLLPFMPTAQGQGRGNSGCYLQGRYEVQILDSFGLEGKIDECGAIYGIKPPDFNACLPPLSWQTYDIDYQAAKFDPQGKKTTPAKLTVRHNGHLIQKEVSLPQATRAAPNKEGAEAGPLYLQNHKNPIRFRNIWIVERRG